MSPSTRQALISVVVFLASTGVWFGTGVLRGIAHVTHLPIEPFLEVLLYAGTAGMLVGLILMIAYVPRWTAEHQHQA